MVNIRIHILFKLLENLTELKIVLGIQLPKRKLLSVGKFYIYRK